MCHSQCSFPMFHKFIRDAFVGPAIGLHQLGDCLVSSLDTWALMHDGAQANLVQVALLHHPSLWCHQFTILHGLYFWDMEALRLLVVHDRACGSPKLPSHFAELVRIPRFLGHPSDRSGSDNITSLGSHQMFVRWPSLSRLLPGNSLGATLPPASFPVARWSTSHSNGRDRTTNINLVSNFAFRVQCVRSKQLLEAPHTALNILIGLRVTKKTVLSGRDGVVVSLDRPPLDIFQEVHQRWLLITVEGNSRVLNHTPVLRRSRPRSVVIHSVAAPLKRAMRGITIFGGLRSWSFPQDGAVQMDLGLSAALA